MKATLKMNRQGHIEVWFVRKTPRECDLYVQEQSSVEGLIGDVPARYREDLEEGYWVRCDIPDEYCSDDEGYPDFVTDVRDRGKIQSTPYDSIINREGNRRS